VTNFIVASDALVDVRSCMIEQSSVPRVAISDYAVPFNVIPT